MCPLRPCSLPTTTGVFVRDTAEWLAYSPAVTAKILESYGLSVSDLTATGDAVKEDRPGSPRSVLGGAPSASASPDRGTLDLGSFGLGGGAYTLDTGTGLQVSPRGFSRHDIVRFCRYGLQGPLRADPQRVRHEVRDRGRAGRDHSLHRQGHHTHSSRPRARCFPGFIRFGCSRIGGGGKAASEETNVRRLSSEQRG